MTKQKFGKKDIFAPSSKVVEKNNVHTEKKSPLKAAPFIREPRVSEIQKTVIHTFRIRADLLERVREYSFFERVNIYDTLNQALTDFLKNYKPKYPARL